MVNSSIIIKVAAEITLKTRTAPRLADLKFFFPNSVLEQIIGRIPFVGTITSAVSTAKVLVDSNASVSIKNAGGYAMISVTDSVAGVSTVVRGWSNYPYIYLYDIHATNINVTLSPKNNPFNH